MSSSNSKQGDDDDDDDGLEHQMEAVLQLMSKRVRGEVTNDQVEAAVTDILSSMGASAPPQNHGENVEATTESKQIQVDTGNYDDDDDIQEEEKEDANKETPTRISEKTNNGSNNAKAQKQALKKLKDEEKMREGAYQDVISQIPLGKEGSKMMTTFGDGPKPIPKAIEAALLGTRKSLQIAIMDARAIRRRAKQNFEEARQSFVHRNKSSQSDAVDPSMLYRALSGYDRLTLQPKCGFDMEQLTWLFPEEMREYQRWDDMHNECQKNVEEDLKSNGQESVGGEEKKGKEDRSLENAELIGGHLKERAAHFDVRTEQMKSEWYMQFSKVRQGSFLARGKRTRKSKAEIQWEENRKSKRGRREAGIWETMPATSVRFMHWLGFEPPTIHPPNEETTQALAFLGYDIMGRIIEKAIFLRNLERIKQNKGEIDETNIVWELKRGEQLTPDNIEDAMLDPDIRPALLHSLGESSQPSFQLYFGPGFEQRLELEMEELIAAEKTVRLSDEERTIRQNEATVFAKLSSPPIIVDSLNHLLEQRQREEKEKEEEQPPEQQAKRPRSES